MRSHRVGHNWSNVACMHALETEMATHSSILAWRIPGTEEPGGLPSVGSHRVRHDWSDLAAAAANWLNTTFLFYLVILWQCVSYIAGQEPSVSCSNSYSSQLLPLHLPVVTTSFNPHNLKRWVLCRYTKRDSTTCLSHTASSSVNSYYKDFWAGCWHLMALDGLWTHWKVHTKPCLLCEVIFMGLWAFLGCPEG